MVFYLILQEYNIYKFFIILHQRRVGNEFMYLYFVFVDPFPASPVRVKSLTDQTPRERWLGDRVLLLNTYWGVTNGFSLVWLGSVVG